MSLMESILNGADVRDTIKFANVPVNEAADFDTFIRFISGYAPILVQNEKDFKKFVAMLRDHKCEQILKSRKSDGEDWNEWVSLAHLNNRDPNCFIFEFQPGKGLTWEDDIEKATSWFGEAPMKL